MIVTVSTLRPGPAFANAITNQNGYQYQNNHPGVMDGLRAYVVSYALGPKTHTCELMDAVTNNGPYGSYTNQIETGFLHCGTGDNIDGNCSTNNDRVLYAETLIGGSYTCYPDGHWSQGDGHELRITEEFSGTWGAYISGHYIISLSGYDSGSRAGNIGTVWGEHVSKFNSGICDSGIVIHTHFTQIQRYNFAENAYSPIYANNVTNLPNRTSCYAPTPYENQAFQINLH